VPHMPAFRALLLFITLWALIGSIALFFHTTYLPWIVVSFVALGYAQVAHLPLVPNVRLSLWQSVRREWPAFAFSGVSLVLCLALSVVARNLRS